MEWKEKLVLDERNPCLCVWVFLWRQIDHLKYDFCCEKESKDD